MLSDSWLVFAPNFIFLLSAFALVLSLLVLSNFMHNKNSISPEANRRIIHVTVGLLISFSPLIFSSNIYPTILGVLFVLVNLISVRKNAFYGIHSQERESYGTIYFPLSYSIIVLFFWDKSIFVTLSLLILALSDSIAGHIGGRNNSWPDFKVWYDRKTYVGTFAFLSTTIIILFFGSFFFKGVSYLQSLLFILIVAFFSTLSEITSKKGSDNLSVPLISILIMIALDEKFLSDENIIMFLIFIGKLFLITFFLFVSYKIKVLSLSGFIGATIMGCLLLLYGYSFHFLLLATFFILSSTLSLAIKKLRFTKSKNSNRNVMQVICNGGIPLLLCIISYFNTNPIFQYLYAASVATVMSDTWATEFGKLSRSRPISITSFKSVPHGLSGGITLYGTLGSLVGSCIIALLTKIFFSLEVHLILGVFLCGFFGSSIDSLLGDKLQRKYQTSSGNVIENPEKGSKLISGYNLIDNNLVNFIASISGPLFMYLYIIIIT
ncbi:MAG: hypothetical protein CMG63_03845 [Candidatus Marinimicrobia bacterium]|nr:hypothetical protein [Candidatus Neomarinimicrobiota bacterium]